MNNKLLDIADKLLFISFCLLSVFAAFSNALVEIATASIIGLWIIKRAAEKDYKLPAGALGIILMLFAAWNLASFINTHYMYESFRGLLKVVKHTLLFLAAADYFKLREQFRRFAFFAVFAGFFIALNGIAQYILGTDLLRHRVIDQLDWLHRVSSSFCHPNDYGAYLIVIVMILLGFLFSKAASLKERLLYLIFLLPNIWCLWATDSRGAWLGLVAALLFFAVTRSRKAFALVMALVLIASFMLPVVMKPRFSDLADFRKGSGTVWERVMLWEGAANMVKVHPVLGFGVNTYSKNYPDYRPEEYGELRYTHNSYLQMATEIGITGAVLFLLFLAMLITQGCVSLKLYPDIFPSILAGTTGFLVSCAVDTHLYSTNLSAFLFLFLGIIAAFKNIKNEHA